MRKSTVSYVLAIVTGVVLAGILSWLAIRERDRSVAAAHETVRESSRAIAGALRGSIQAEIYGTKLLQDRLQSVLDGVVSTTDVNSILLKQDDQVLAAAGTDISQGRFADNGEELAGNTFFYWETIRLQAMKGPIPGHGGGKGNAKGRGKGKGQGHGWRRRETADAPEVEGLELDLGDTSQILAVGLSAGRYWAEAQAAEKRMWLTIAIGIAAAIALTLVWMLTARGQSLRAELQAARNRAEQLGEFELAAFGLAHETKHPLGIIRGLAQQIADSSEEGVEQKEKATSIMQEADVAVDRLGDFMLYAKSRAPATEAVALHGTVERIANVMRPDFDSEGVTLALETVDVSVEADEDMLSRVLINLLKNALQACKKDDTVTIAISTGESSFQCAVRDNGCGIPQDLLADVFKPYVTGREDGHGIGLAIVKRITDEHGWEIAVESTEGNGTTFTVSGPISKE